MLNRREFLVASVAAGVLTVTGDVAFAAPSPALTGKLVGHSFFCLFDIYDGRVAMEDVDHIFLTAASFIRVEQRLDNLAHLERRQLRNPRRDYGVAKMQDALLYRTLLDADKLKERKELDEFAGIAWTRGGQPFDSGGTLSEPRLRRFACLLNDDDFVHYS